MTQLSLSQPPASPSLLATSGNGVAPSFCEKNRAIVATFLHHQGAVLAMIQAFARQAADGGGDLEQTLQRIDLVATKACQDSDQMALAVGSLPVQS
ncbi:hypothetical protein [Pseudomonas sp. PARCl1]|jgi:hypothetical protein|uniref:hypothetical protein n=1 Tax=Pseudomonas sp. PARCl1 TaxID=2853444 RepID=UPI001C77AD46|nr:hypothetical protein [Pseudomonas sp. PARCl1]QXM18701.1 hypothetical protein [Pseudomonas phage PARCL1pr]DAY63721.1 MAG TPA: hypothetical protein [Caudoviricetes sp.]